MKRALLHITFWTVYLFQDVLLISLLNTTRMPSQAEAVSTAIENCFVLLLPKLFFTYFILYVTLPQITKDAVHIRKGILNSILALLAALIVYRALLVYFVNPIIYQWTINVPGYFNLFGFLVALMDIGFASGAAIAIKLVRLRLAGKETEKNLIREKLETELKYLRNQTQPHFLFNTLNNIYALARKKSDETPDVVMKLSKLLRFVLYETAKPSIRIGDEIKVLEDYIDLEKIRYGSRLTMHLTKEIDDENEQISPLILLPFIENAFKHGAGESRFESYIHVDIKLQESVLTFNVENTKENNERQDINENIGLRNVKRQLELMYKDYDMQVQNETALFKVRLKINLGSHAKI